MLRFPSCLICLCADMMISNYSAGHRRDSGLPLSARTLQTRERLAHTESGLPLSLRILGTNDNPVNQRIPELFSLVYPVAKAWSESQYEPCENSDDSGNGILCGQE